MKNIVKIKYAKCCANCIYCKLHNQLVQSLYYEYDVGLYCTKHTIDIKFDNGKIIHSPIRVYSNQICSKFKMLKECKL